MMLVLSRRPNETIRFPQLGISVSIVSVKGNRVQVGVDAPPQIQVLRRELELTAKSNTSLATVQTNNSVAERLPSEYTDRRLHEYRNRLNQAMLGLQLAKRQLAAGQTDSADRTLAVALEKLSQLEATATEKHSPTSTCPSVGLKAFASSRLSSGDGLSVSGADQRPQCIDVLLVEDDLNERALLSGLLEMEGYRVHTASNGHEAIGCLQHVTPKFVLLDMMMPGCDGRETFQIIRQTPGLENVPVFAVSGSTPDSVGLSVGSDGVEDWFPKPLDASRLVKSMRHQLANRCAV